MTGLSSTAIGDRTISVAGAGGDPLVTGATVVDVAFAGDDLNINNNNGSTGFLGSTTHTASWTVDPGKENILSQLGISSSDLKVAIFIGDDTLFAGLASQDFNFEIEDGNAQIALFSGTLFATDPLPSTNSNPPFQLNLSPVLIPENFDGNNVASLRLNATLDGAPNLSNFEIDRILIVPETSAISLIIIGLFFIAGRRNRPL